MDYAVPWPKPEKDAGLSLAVNVKGPLAVGKSSEVELTAVAPGGVAIRVTQGLPAGVDAVRSSLEELVASGTITKFEVTDGVVVLDAPARAQGALVLARYKVVRATPSSDAVFFPPSLWNIAR